MVIRYPTKEDENFSEIDPFAPRPGCSLSWSNVSVTTKSKSAEQAVPILRGVSGAVESGRVLCILGHSGAGKTTLLNVLAGRLTGTTNNNNSRKTCDADVSGDIAVNGTAVDCASRVYRQQIAYAEQHRPGAESDLLATATPREAIRFAARLRLPVLRLDTVADRRIGRTYVGPGGLDGLSGGERRRVAVGTQLVVRPQLLFLDEPTSGLDSHNAYVVLQTCQRIAQTGGATVVITIHQPGSKLYEIMDQLYVLHESRCLYEGPADQSAAYFAARGFQRPAHYSPCDWMMEISQTQPTALLEGAGFTNSFCRLLYCS